MLNNTIAKRYAKALFDLIYTQSKGDDTFLKSVDLLKNISETIQLNGSLNNVLFSPSFGIEEKKRVLAGIVDQEARQGVSSPQSEYLKSFFSILIKKSKLVFLPAVVEEIEILKTGLSKTTEVLLTVPVSVSDDEKNAFTQKLEKMFLQKIRLTVKISPEILGGMTLQVGSKVFDASLQMKLSHLRNSLMGQ